MVPWAKRWRKRIGGATVANDNGFSSPEVLASTMTRPTLYVADDQDSKQACDILREAGFSVDVRPIPLAYLAVYGAPVLFGLSTKFEGVTGVRVFIKNARVVGYQNNQTT